MGTCFLYGQSGGGTGKVKTLSGGNLPDSPTKNALWVQSDTAVADYIFSPVQPEDAVYGCVWLKTIEEGVNFILDKKQKLRFHLRSAYQYVDGVWKSVSVYLGTDNGWERIVNSRQYLFLAGNQYSDLTGNWRKYTNGNGGTVSFGESINIGMILTADYRYASLGTTNTLDLTPYRKLYMKGVATQFNNLSGLIKLGTATRTDDPTGGGGAGTWTSVNSLEDTYGSITLSVDISALTNPQYVKIYANRVVVQITEVWLEV